MENADVARVLEEIGLLLRLQEGNPFKVRAYLDAAQTIRRLDERLDDLAAEGRLREVPGIGAAIAQKIEDFRTTGTIPLREKLAAEIPVGVLEMVAVPGVGPKRARAAFEALGVASLAALAEAAESGRLAEVPGFGPRTSARVLVELERLQGWSDRWLASRARAAAEGVLARVAACPATVRADVAGSLRRGVETVRDVDLLAASDDPGAVLEAFVSHPAVADVERRGEAMARARLGEGLPVDLRVVPPVAWPFALVHFTGSAGHNARLRERAKRRGAKLNEYVLVDADGAAVEATGEADVYAALGLAWIPPELREDRGEVAAAARGALPALVARADLRGLLHVHTTWSDGRASVRGMAEAARARGFDWMGVCDHSRGAAYAGGLSIDDLARQRDEIALVNEEVDGVTVLAGSEVDVHPDGTLDYPDEVLAGLDVVVASVHGGFGLPRAEQTARLRRVIENPWVDVLGHPTGRLLLKREGIDVDVEAVLDAAAEHGVVVEVNGDPRRLELDWRWHRAALERGVLLAVDPDAHGVDTIEPLVQEALRMARKGGVGPASVVNAMDVDGFRARLRRNAGGARGAPG